jgi:putative membrane protein
MVSFILKFIFSAVLVYGLSMVLPNVRLDGFSSAAILVIVMGILNAIVKPILKFLGFPLTMLTLGLFLLVINVIIVKLADFLMSSFSVKGFLSALIFSLGLSVVNTVVDLVTDND